MDMENKLETLCEIQCKILSCLKENVDGGLESLDTYEMGAVVDIVKDLAQTEKYIREAYYYKLVAEAMEDGDDTTRRNLGYTPGVSNNLHMGTNPLVN